WRAGARCGKWRARWRAGAGRAPAGIRGSWSTCAGWRASMRHLVLGAGQVGAAVAEVLADVGEVALRDVDPTDDRADVLHVCIPWSSGFTDAVKDAVTRHRTELVVVHSTVPVGTCDPHGWVHSPVRGRH